MPLDVREINEAYFDGCNFESVMRGIHVAVYIMALSKIFTGPERTAQSRKLMTILVTLFFVMSTIHHVSYWTHVRRAFITRGATAESTAESLNEYPIWYIGTTSVSDANAILADCVIIWRCWVVWGRSWKITILPILCTKLTTAFSMIAILGVVTSTTFGDVRVDYATALYSTSLVTTLYCTTVIVYRVVQVGSRSTIGPGLRSYQGILEILIESSALYFFATLFALVAYTQSGPVSQFASAFWTSVTVSLIRYYFGSVLCRLLTLCWGIAPTLVVARVAAGDARPNQTWNNQAEGPALSFLRFNDFDEESTGGATSGTHKHTDNTKSYVDDVETTALPGKTVSSGSEELHSAEKIV